MGPLTRPHFSFMKTRPGAAAYNQPGAPGLGPVAEIDPGITSLVDLAAVATTNLLVPSLRYWIMAADGTTQAWQLIASTAATGEGAQRPGDFDADTNAKVWFKASS
jgi:hypothetical protein